MSEHRFRIGVDMGGTKIAAALLAPDGSVADKRRMPTPSDDYAATVRTVAEIAAFAAAPDATIGIGMPGSLTPKGRVQNANSTWLNGSELGRDLAHATGKAVRLANDANCFALSEATDGAGANFQTVFGVILGTGCGGGFVAGGRLIDGPNRIAGEWGHTPLPHPSAEEADGPTCWCGRTGCMEAWVSGPALSADHRQATGARLDVPIIVELAKAGDELAMASLARHASRLARGLANVVNIVDPHVIVLGGGLSNIGHFYAVLPDLMRPLIFADAPRINIRPAVHGDDSGVRGAAWLWNAEMEGYADSFTPEAAA
ncbi:MAG: ROK family protein [Rhodobiaceae bacterium]|nr:ROK family protein [Rhodobiaceae bacterium]MCC0057005.1 ROK family protein [Rhodobiaceae bacterium]